MLRRVACLTAALFCLALCACNRTAPASGETDTVSPAVTTAAPETTTAAPETTTAAPETTTAAPETTTTAPETVTAAPETVTAAPETTAAQTQSTPAFVNPLTGLATETDLSAQRPAAIMVNNIRVSCPQNGVSKADVMYECLVEGGYTRLMMLVLDYAALPEVGSVRSARDYYLDFAADYDALFVHAGGSEYAYDAIDERGVENLDGVNMYDLHYMTNTFYRSQARVLSMGTEHSLMTTGEGIAAGVKYKKYRTALTQDFNFPLDFTPDGTTVAWKQEAKHIRIPYSIAQTTDFVYDAASGLYLRYQFGGEKHVDGATGEQLAFENALIIFCQTGAITGDPKNRIDVGTVGEGSGYYATRGTVTPITWKKASHAAPIEFFDADGNPLLLNRGKTFVSVCPTTLVNQIQFNFVW